MTEILSFDTVQIENNIDNDSHYYYLVHILREVYHAKKKDPFPHPGTRNVIVCICDGLRGNNKASSNTPTATTEATTAPSAEATAVPDASAAEMRSYETTKGTVQIPVKPQRIVTDYYGGELLSVGANVIGVEPSTFDNPFLKDLLKNTQDVGAPVNAESTRTCT